MVSAISAWNYAEAFIFFLFILFFHFLFFSLSKVHCYVLLSPGDQKYKKLIISKTKFHVISKKKKEKKKDLSCITDHALEINHFPVQVISTLLESSYLWNMVINRIFLKYIAFQMRSLGL